MNGTAAETGEQFLRVLIVDDNPLVLSALVDFLGDDPRIRVVGAALRTQDALVLAESSRPDAVLVDAHMPGGGGEEVIAAVRRLLPTVRIVALSALFDQVSISRLLAAGADLHFSKAEDIDFLIRSITS